MGCCFRSGGGVGGAPPSRLFGGGLSLALGRLVLRRPARWNVRGARQPPFFQFRGQVAASFEARQEGGANLLVSLLAQAHAKRADAVGGGELTHDLSRRNVHVRPHIAELRNHL